jgi:hypothetical protein
MSQYIRSLPVWPSATVPARGLFIFYDPDTDEEYQLKPDQLPVPDPGTGTGELTGQALLDKFKAGNGIELVLLPDDTVLVNCTVEPAAAPLPPDAPTDGRVDDVANTFSGVAVSGFTSYVEYVYFTPDSGGVKPLIPPVGYQSGNRITVSGLTGPCPPNSVGIAVAASGNRPQGRFLLNAEAFTGTVVVTPPTTTYTATQQTYQATAQDYLAKCGSAAPSGYQGPSRSDSSQTSTVSQADANAKSLAVATQQAKDAIVCLITSYEFTLTGPSDQDTTGITLTTDGGAYTLNYDRVYGGDSTGKRLDIFLAGNELAAVDFPASYLGKPFIFTANGITYRNTYTDGSLSL